MPPHRRCTPLDLNPRGYIIISDDNNPPPRGGTLFQGHLGASRRHCCPPTQAKGSPPVSPPGALPPETSQQYRAVVRSIRY